jgi:small subunit ribosomal protein S5
MREIIDEAAALESTTVGVYRTAATVKGGRRFSFAALVVVGDRNGRLGVGYGKANQVPPAIEKAQKEARRRMRAFPMQGRTIPHAVTGRFGACLVRLLPASPGAGVIAGAAVRAPLEMLGVQDCLTKSFGSNNPKNLVKAVVNGLEHLRSKEVVAALRGREVGPTEVEERIERGKAYLATGPAVSSEKAAAPIAEGPARGGRGRRPRRTGPAAPPKRPAAGAADAESPPTGAAPTTDEPAPPRVEPDASSKNPPPPEGG